MNKSANNVHVTRSFSKGDHIIINPRSEAQVNGRWRIEHKDEPTVICVIIIEVLHFDIFRS